jgi:hypothetical protein
MDAEVSATLEAWFCVFRTTFCTFTLISCMVVDTSSIAEEACTPSLADSSEASATWLEPAATWLALSRTWRTRPRKPPLMEAKALPMVSRSERGRVSMFSCPRAMHSAAAAISFR